MAGNVNEEQLEMLELIEESGYRMLEIINLSHDLYKMETGIYEFEPEPVDLLKVVKKIIKELKSTLDARKQSIKTIMSEKKNSAKKTENLRF